MANTDLQYLYKMRELLEREEYVKNYNAQVIQNLNTAVNITTSQQLEQKNKAQKYYENLKDQKFNTLNKRKRDIILLIYWLAIGLLSLLAVSISSNINRSLIFILCTTLWASVIMIIILIGSEKGVSPLMLLSVACVFLVISLASSNGVSGFFHWLGAIIVFITWPISNFFFMKPVIWLSVITQIVNFVSILTVNAFMDDDVENNQSDKNYSTANDADVISAKREFEKISKEYEEYYNHQYSLLKAEYQKALKGDTYTKEKRAMQSIIPANLQNLDLINKLIWCIEQRYANDIVSARNWYLQQAYNQAMLNKLNAIADETRKTRQVAERAAADAAAAHRAIIAAVNENTNAINNQSQTISNDINNLKRVVGRGVQAAERGAKAAEEGATYSRKNWLDS